MKPTISGDAAQTILRRMTTILRPLLPTAAIYEAAMSRCASIGLRSGAILDALHLATAEARDADILLTWNLGDFDRLARDRELRIRSPDEVPPGA